MSQIEVPKANMWVRTGAADANATVAKIGMYVRLEPGADTSVGPSQGHVYVQKIRRAP